MVARDGDYSRVACHVVAVVRESEFRGVGCRGRRGDRLGSRSWGACVSKT